MTTKHELYQVFRPDITDEERSTCGFRRRMIKGQDFPAVSITHLRVSDATPHYHKKSTEFYYVLKGKGHLVIDGEEVPVEPDTLLKIDPPAVHAARGDLTVLILCSPAHSDDDIFFPDGEAAP